VNQKPLASMQKGGAISRWIACVPVLSLEGSSIGSGVGDRTSTAGEAVITVAGLCRIHTGFATTQLVVL